MTSYFLTVLALLSAVSVSFVVPTAASKDGGLSWTIYHSWNQNQDFVRRGQLVWGPSEEDEKFEFQIVNDDDASTFQPKDVREMLDYGWYHVKIQGSEGSFVFQTVPACNLRRANFKDQFEITFPRSSLGNKQDVLTSFAYTPLVSPLAPKTCDEYLEDDSEKSFSSRVSVQMDTPAMTLKAVLPQSKPPPGIKFVQQPNQSGSTGSAGGSDEDGNPIPNATPTPFGFLSKYWYIILPMMLMQLITAPAEEEGKQGQQGEQGAPPQVAAATAAAAPAQKARRGKTSRKTN